MYSCTARSHPRCEWCTGESVDDSVVRSCAPRGMYVPREICQMWTGGKRRACSRLDEVSRRRDKKLGCIRVVGGEIRRLWTRIRRMCGDRVPPLPPSALSLMARRIMRVFVRLNGNR